MKDNVIGRTLQVVVLCIRYMGSMAVDLTRQYYEHFLLPLWKRLVTAIKPKPRGWSEWLQRVGERVDAVTLFVHHGLAWIPKWLWLSTFLFVCATLLIFFGEVLVSTPSNDPGILLIKGLIGYGFLIFGHAYLAGLASSWGGLYRKHYCWCLSTWTYYFLKRPYLSPGRLASFYSSWRCGCSFIRQRAPKLPGNLLGFTPTRAIVTLLFSIALAIPVCGALSRYAVVGLHATVLEANAFQSLLEKRTDMPVGLSSEEDSKSDDNRKYRLLLDFSHDPLGAKESKDRNQQVKENLAVIFELLRSAKQIPEEIANP